MACGEMHERGKYLFTEMYILIRQWYVPSKHAGMLHPKLEKKTPIDEEKQGKMKVYICNSD